MVDWSKEMTFSDLFGRKNKDADEASEPVSEAPVEAPSATPTPTPAPAPAPTPVAAEQPRSEERRVGKECRL